MRTALDHHNGREPLVALRLRNARLLQVFGGRTGMQTIRHTSSS
jgi:hypothetical protein